MGYYTRHDMIIKYETYAPNDILDALQEIEGAFYAFDFDEDMVYHDENNKIIHLFEDDESKWYGECYDMQKIARQFPEATFVVHGIGEEHGDEWEHYYKGNEYKARQMMMMWGEWT